MAARGQLVVVATILAVVTPQLASGQTVNVALQKPVSALYTCGLFGVESFNTLTDASDAMASRTRRTCVDARQPGPDRPDLRAKPPSYPPSNIVDGLTSTWWQSTSRARIYRHGFAFAAEKNKELEAIITLDLLQEFLVESIIIQLGDALTPQRIVIHKSLDGLTFEPWVYAVSNLDWCTAIFSMDIRDVPETLGGTVCVSFAADDLPPGDTISLNFVQVPASLKEWSRARYIKVKFYDMLFVAPFNALANTYNHYAVAELTVMAECPCNGQQTGCVVSPTTGMYECVCGGNTRGRYCELCQPLFNQFKFQYNRPCTQCNCFNHATSCFYEEAVEAAGGSLDISGQRAGGGVCIDCKHNTDGNNCERCVSMFYRPINVLQTSEGACVPCACNPFGSTVNPETNDMDCVMNNDVTRADGKLPGDCFCKTNVQGSKCDTCKERFFNIQPTNPDGCTACGCYTPGTVGASELCTPDALGQCPCKPNVQGRTCSECKDGFYGLNGEDANGCTPCGCDVGGSVNQICNKLTGQCLCRSNNIVGRTCNSVRDQFYFPSPHSIAAEFEDGFGDVQWDRDDQFAGYFGNGYAVLSAGESISSLIMVPVATTLSRNFTAILRYSSSDAGAVNISVGGQTVHPLDLALPACAQQWCTVNSPDRDTLHLTPGPNLLSLTVTSAGVLRLDNFVAFPVEFLNPTAVLPAPLPQGCDLLNNRRPIDPTARAACDAATFSLTMFYWSSPLVCECDLTGSTSASCEVNGGQCDCRPGVVGRTCDKCSPDTYNFGPTGCAECSCDAFSTSCDPLTGQCECPDNTFGRQCQFCLPNHWDWHQTQGCKPCTCDPLGSLSLQCNATSGLCPCKPGVQGDNCDTCKDGFHSFGAQGCLPCDCNLAGSQGNVCYKTSGQCPCKANVEGIKCTTCKRGTFALGSSETLGCQNCVCMGVTTECYPGTTTLSHQLYPLSSRDGATATPTITLTNTDGSPNSQPVQVTTDLPTTLTIQTTAAQQRLFWKMPDTFTSNLVTLYGTDLTFVVNFVVVDGSTFTAHEVRLISATPNRALIYTTPGLFQGSDTQLKVTLRETGWVDEVGRLPVSRAEFLKHLATAKMVLIPASFSTGSFTARLSSLSFSVESAAGTVNVAAEKCTCGIEYTGGSCEECSLGYKRVNVSTSPYLGECVRCDCNGHSPVCDADTGVCEDCLHDTTGDTCEECQVGFYGDATQGTSADCTPCPCYLPRVINATCEANATTGTVKCSFCREGYVGDLCHKCDSLYYGNPGSPGGACSPCQCNGNAATCDSLTGVCDNCGSNTTGDNCESCAVNFFGNATKQECQECACVPVTSTSTVCDASTGQCPCVSGVGGRTCSECQLGFWGYDNDAFLGCRACGCVEAGSTSVQCDSNTGTCSCKPNTSGALCDTCEDGFFGLPTAPCEACGCDLTGTVPGQLCDKATGQCQCQPGVGGRQCDQCLPFYVNFTSAGCDKCGPCQESLGENIDKLETRASAVLATADVVKGVQEQDDRLQNLSVQLNTSLVALGLANTNATSATEIINNITITRDTLVTAYGTLQSQATALETTTDQMEINAQTQFSRQRQLTDSTTALTRDYNDFEDTLAQYIQITTQHSSSAAQYAAAGSDSGTTTLSFAPELAQAQAVLTKVRDTTSMDATRNTVAVQAQVLSSLNDSVTSQFSELDQQSTTVSDLDSTVNTIAASLATADNDMEQAQDYKSQADELVTAVTTTLTNTERANTDASAALNAARVGVRNTNSILSGDARTVMTGDDHVPFPTGVANFETAISSLQSRLTSLPVLIEVVGPKIIEAESHLTTLETTLKEVNNTYKTIPLVATDAVLAIKNFEEVITDLGNSVTMAQDANNLIIAIRTDVSGDAFEERRQSYDAEKTTAEKLRAEMSAKDYQIQVLQSSIQTATTRLNNEPTLWSLVDTSVDQMTSAANALNTKVQETSLNAQLTEAFGKVDEAGAIIRTVASSVSNQDAVLTLKEEEVTQTEQMIVEAEELRLSASTRLAVQQAKITNIQSNRAQASALTQAADTRAQQIAEKIRLLEDKLANAESLLSQLRHPLTFGGDLGLTFSNQDGATEHLYDEVSLEMRKPAAITDGVMFFVDDPNSADQIQVGLKQDKVFFQYDTGTSPVVLESPATICDNCWVRVDATRYGQVGHLIVTTLSNGGSVSVSTPDSTTNTASTISLPSSIYVGTLLPEVQTTKVTNRQFTGCLHNVEYQGEVLNLWTNAVATSPTATCCSYPPSLPGEATVPGNTFSGLGYLVLSPPSIQGQPLLISQIQRVALDFRTFSTSVTLFLVQTPDGTGYMSVGLDNGSVKSEILTGGQLVRTQVQGQFSTGQWVQVSADLTATTLSLSVRFTDPVSAPSVSQVTFSQLDLSAFNNQNFILGSESNPLVEGYSPTDNNFAGCMRNLIVTTATAGSNTISFTENVVRSVGVSPNGCIDQVINAIRFTSDNAFTQFSPVNELQQLRSLRVDFVTTKTSALLLYVRAAGSTRFLYIAVFGGNVLVVYRQDSTRSILSSGQFVSDGQVHSVELDMVTSRVSMRVDGVTFEEITQTLTAPYLGYPASAILSLAGVPAEVTLPPECPVKESLVGGISVLLINGVPDAIGFSNTLENQDVSLAGIPAPPTSPPVAPVTNPTTPLETCPVAPVPVLLPLAQGFVLDGSHVVSWTELAPTDSPVSFIVGSFKLGISFTTYKADGVLVYIANSLSTPSNYFAVFLQDSTVVVKMKSSLQEDITVSLAKKYNTGQRYQLEIIRINEYIAVTVALENDYANSNKNSETASTLNIDFARQLYFGGLGANDVASSPLPNILKQTGRTNFAGAIYTVRLSNEPEDNFISFPISNLDRSTAPAIPQSARYGLSLRGGATTSYLGLGVVSLGASVTIEIGLTTSSSSGLVFLLYQTTPILSFIALDVHENQLRLHLPATFAGLTVPLMMTVDDEANICDSQPHTLIIAIDSTSRSVTITVDGTAASTQTISVSHQVRAMSNAQFHVAGVPDPKPASLPESLQTGSLSACITTVTRTSGSVSQTYDPTQHTSASTGFSYGCPY